MNKSEYERELQKVYGELGYKINEIARQRNLLDMGHQSDIEKALDDKCGFDSPTTTTYSKNKIEYVLYLQIENSMPIIIYNTEFQKMMSRFRNNFEEYIEKMNEKINYSIWCDVVKLEIKEIKRKCISHKSMNKNTKKGDQK